ncbi:CsbD family protein [Modestobacter sp. I12A-02628]|uniref:CsbD family protein n=1 Tax=Goekera deserti TaxID=2497753 RepID=A0A7K3WIV6_9ACTN|nr:CsbD family protein [Goekera deserti]MPQ96638.1 CsbD family protein [Goekera deserti]NDI47050.1 CsbD family protein [Goekera deserti]NEL56286.1 CsbD family protein [Goekera deserti]
MSLGDKIKNKADELAGQAKEVVGTVTGNEELQAEGKADQTGAEIKQVGESVKDVFKN